MKALFALLFILPALAKQPYVATGDKIEHDYLKAGKRLENYYRTLKDRLMRESPELLKELSPVPPTPLLAGYQLLPKLVEDWDREDTKNYSINTYSWPRTREFLNTMIHDIAKQEKALKTIKNLNYENLVKNYQALEFNQSNIGSHIYHNRTWQENIALNRKNYEERNRLYKDLRKGTESYSNIVLRLLEKPMSEPHPEVKLMTSGRKKTIQVSLTTDIEDKNFVKLFQEVAEKHWQLKDGENEYSVKLNFHYISPAELYGSEKPPKQGEEIDLVRHLEHFPEGKIVVTTGTGTTYYSVAKVPFIAVGVAEIPKRVLAHEFGHVLTLDDAYFRAYKEIGKEGLEIYEVVPDYTDIMASPSYGSVKKHHFDLVFDAIEKRDNRSNGAKSR